MGKNIETVAMGSYLDTKQVNHITIDVSYEFINMKAGANIPIEKVQKILKSLGFGFRGDDSQLQITVTSWRASKDVSIKEDIAEEVIRIYRYDTIDIQSLGANSGISTRNQTKAIRDISLDYWR